MTVPLCVCGATSSSPASTCSCLGSALRVRGNHLHPGIVPLLHRFRSACAGQPVPGAAGSGRHRVPLCVCGATCGFEWIRWRYHGSALRVRGNPGIRLTARCRRRFRSACAGQPLSLLRGNTPSGVPLCVCGATQPDQLHAGIVPGSALRVRGNPFSALAVPGDAGFRSACAGQPHTGLPAPPA